MRDRFDSFDEFLNTLYRGNEVILEYNEHKFSIFPFWNNDVVSGFYIGEMYKTFSLCKNSTELKKYTIFGDMFFDIFMKMKVIDSVL